MNKKVSATGDVSTTITERRGVCEIEKKCCEIHWVFRERGHSDFGVDADMEEAVLVKGEPRLTNRHIAIQIKSGKSYVKHDRAGRYYFDIEDERTANYWLNSDRPVLVMVYDNGYISKRKKGSKDGNIEGTVLWAQIKPSNFAPIPHRNSSKVRKDGKPSQHIFARVYIDNTFGSESARDFSNIISSYVPITSSELQAPPIFYNSGYYELIALKLATSFADTIDIVDNIAADLPTSPDADYSSEKLLLHIDLLRMTLSSKLNVDNNLLAHFIGMVNQIGVFPDMNFEELLVFRKNQVEKNKETLSELRSLLGYISKDISELGFQNQVQIDIIKQTQSIIEDYSTMLDNNNKLLDRS